ncbi:MAG: S16 family serine protease [Desulfobulbales bacterium]
MPEQNAKDLVEIPKDIRDQMEFIPVKNMDQILKVAFRETKSKKSL